MRRHHITTAGAAIAFLASCGPDTEVVNTAVPDMELEIAQPEVQPPAPTVQQPAYENTESWGEWQAGSELDPMDDTRSYVAQVDVPGQLHDVRITTRCKPDALMRLSYEIDGFDKQGDASELDRRMGVKWRADRDESQSSSGGNPRFSNRKEIEWIYVLGMTRAQTLTLQVFFTDGDEVYQIDQTQSAFRRTIKPCLEHRDIDPQSSVKPITASAIERMVRGEAVTSATPAEIPPSKGPEADEPTDRRPDE